MSQTRKCRVPGPCWGCRHKIERGETYVAITVWAENGPRRTARVHVECNARLNAFTRDDWEDWQYEPAANLHWWDDFAESCPRCTAERFHAAAGTPIDAEGRTL